MNSTRLHFPKHHHTHHHFHRFLHFLAQQLRKNTVMYIALLAALITMIFVPVDAEYLSYFDYKTLTCLFCVLAVVCALKNMRFFYLLASIADTSGRYSFGVGWSTWIMLAVYASLAALDLFVPGKKD